MRARTPSRALASVRSAHWRKLVRATIPAARLCRARWRQLVLPAEHRSLAEGRCFPRQAWEQLFALANMFTNDVPARAPNGRSSYTHWLKLGRATKPRARLRLRIGAISFGSQTEGVPPSVARIGASTFGLQNLGPLRRSAAHGALPPARWQHPLSRETALGPRNSRRKRPCGNGQSSLSSERRRGALSARGGKRSRGRQGGVSI